MGSQHITFDELVPVTLHNSTCSSSMASLHEQRSGLLRSAGPTHQIYFSAVRHRDSDARAAAGFRVSSVSIRTLQRLQTDITTPLQYRDRIVTLSRMPLEALTRAWMV